MKPKITFVTTLYDIGRGDINPSFSRSFDHYKESFSKLLKHQDINLVVYCDQSLNDFVYSHKTKNIRVVNRSIEQLRNGFPFFNRIQEIRNSEKWLSQAGWLRESTQACLEFYNPLVMQKQFFLNDATLYNFFGNDHYLWLDAGLYNTVNLDEYLLPEKYEAFEKKLLRKMNKMLYVCFPYDGQVEVHGFSKNGMNKFSGKNTEYVARGGVFGGRKATINVVNDIYYHLLQDSLNNGEMGTEESIFTIITYRHPELCNIEMIEPNGLVYKFFSDLMEDKSEKETDDGSLAFYSLVYNTPNQFEEWINSFKKAYPEEFTNTKKYVINNSTDVKAIDHYNRLFSEYDFEVIHSGSNLGIQDGRQLCATHFDKSPHRHYIFFEEDMHLVDRHNKMQVKDGFVTYVPDLFNRCVDILEHEDLDFLRLTIIEFFGNNIYDWSFKNLPANKKDEYFPVRDDGNEDLRWKSKVDYLGIKNNVAYAVGHFHYSNWPILFNKRGNRQVFLDIVYEHLYEQTVMSQAKMFMMDGKLKVGTLLAAPIHHNRSDHYDGKTRRENRHYKN